MENVSARQRGIHVLWHGVEASSKPVDWDGYLSRYIDFINRHDVQHFFELDVDIHRRL